MTLNSWNPNVDTMALNSKVPLWSRAKHIVASTANTAIGILTPYAMYQAAAHDTISPELWQAISERIWNGIINTAQDAWTVISTLWENFPALRSTMMYELLWSIDEPRFENPWIDSLWGQPQPSYDDLQTTIDVGKQASWAVEKDGGHAWNNMLNSTTETLSAMWGVLATTWAWRKIIWTLALWDSPDFGQRMRFKFFNMFRGKNTSRKINIPKRWGDKFTRK